jgi:phosphate transport system substrate-binding protein
MQSRRRNKVTAAGVAAVAMGLTLAACSSSGPSNPSGGGSSSAGASGTLNGSGSSFQNTFQQAAISAFKQVDSAITVNYASVGSGTGRSNLASGTVNFAGSDSPIPAEEKAGFKGKKVLYFPVLIGPITMSYNLSDVSNLKLTPKIIADIFQAKIKSWNDPEIAAVNPGVKLPSMAITPAVRSDSSGTTQNFALFLQTAAPTVWKLGADSTVKWPSTARAGAQNTGVAQIIKSTPGAIGYVDYADAKASGLTFAKVQNKSGDYVAPTPAGAAASAAGVTINPDLTFASTWGSGAAAYPIAAQTWILVYAQQPNANDAAMLKTYIGYLLGDGQQLLSSIGYAPLPTSLDSKAKAQLSQITS